MINEMVIYVLVLLFIIIIFVFMYLKFRKKPDVSFDPKLYIDDQPSTLKETVDISIKSVNNEFLGRSDVIETPQINDNSCSCCNDRYVSKINELENQRIVPLIGESKDQKIVPLIHENINTKIDNGDYYNNHVNVKPSTPSIIKTECCPVFGEYISDKKSDILTNDGNKIGYNIINQLSLKCFAKTVSFTYTAGNNNKAIYSMDLINSLIGNVTDGIALVYNNNKEDVYNFISSYLNNIYTFSIIDYNGQVITLNGLVRITVIFTDCPESNIIQSKQFKFNNNNCNFMSR